MQKLIVERPRWGSRMRNKKSGYKLSDPEVASAVACAEEYDSGAGRASSARRDKSLNENLAPLRRYLQSQVGRPWTNVFSEIRANLDTRSAIGLHVMQHLYDFITVGTVMVDGVVHGRLCGAATPRPVDGLYVHPVTGIIRYLKPKPRKPWWKMEDEGQQPDFVRIGMMSAYEKLDGLWFLMEYTIGAKGQSVIVNKRQCDRKTIRKVEAGELGELRVRPVRNLWPPERR
ncbi:MAG TPA: hypothetical protein VKE70_28330 [Candidatus Solibacter sp.]|nr:hypothetical protein [Candidatus Solibacter sp.]